MKRSNAKPEYKWDFSHLYKNHQDWLKDVNNVKTLLLKLTTFKKKLHLEKNFIEYIKIDEKIDLISSKLIQYLHYSDLDTTNIEYQKLEGIYSNTVSQIIPQLSFVASELKAIGQTKIMSWIKKHKELAQYEYGYKVFFRNAKHILNENDSTILAKVSQSRSSAFSMYNLLAFADKKPQIIKYQNKEQELTTTLYSDIIQNSDPIKDQELRRVASSKLNYNLVDNKHSFAKVYESIVQYGCENSRIYQYNSVLEKALSNDNVDPKIYLNLIKIGKKYSYLFVNYCNIIKKNYKMKKFYPTDRGLRLIKSFDRKYSVEDAKGIIRNALTPLGTEYLDFLELAWSKNRIDYYEDTNKRSGAYSSGGNGMKPIILMNWDDKINSVNTLAHEIGHSVHTLFADKYQPTALANYPIILAEVASTVNEHLLFDYLYENTTNREEKIYLLQNRIFDIVNTFFRQIHFADFELQAHQMVEKHQPLNAENLVQLFESISDEFGYNVFDKYKDSRAYSWPRISHFFNSPFYVYKYATCVVASFKLYNDVKNGKPNNLINFLKAGGSKDPLDILKDVDVDYNIEGNYLALINKLDSMIKKLKTLLGNSDYVTKVKPLLKDSKAK